MLCIKCNKHKFPVFNCNNITYCTNHSKLLFNNFVIKIQKTYRGYRRRKYVKTIYARLPTELQHYILNFNTNNTKHYDNINSVILKKTHKIKDLTTIEDNEITLAELTNIITMLNKYYHVLDVRWLNYYKYYFNNIKAILVSLIYKKTFLLNINIYNSLNFYENLLHSNFNKVSLLLITKINKFNYLINEHSKVII
jgi:hypothetical protein|uniref:Uncharacterized protein n=1 Tax=viral metagenome TaxID=1070528 RepID=A0A6C0CBL6_9ZZZZ